MVTRGRLGTEVAGRPPLAARAPAPLPEGVVNLADGNPDPALLPDLAPALRRLDPGKHLYGGPICYPPLLRGAARRFAADGISADHLCVVSGALDGLERSLEAHLRPGDRVAVEDPAFLGVLDLLQALALVPVPVALDETGPLPDALDAALSAGCAAFIVTPRAQNPTGAALDATRTRALRRVLRHHADVLVLEDDHAGPVAGVPAHTLADERRARWAVVRSVSKSLGPDLRVAILTGDAATVARVEGGAIIGMRWVSFILQRLVAAVWSQPGIAVELRRAARTYAQRRKGLIEALAGHGIAATGRSGLNVWIPVADEAETVSLLLDRGWAVSAGQRFRLESPPAIRVCTARLARPEAVRLAHAVAEVVRPASAASLV